MTVTWEVRGKMSFGWITVYRCTNEFQKAYLEALHELHRIQNLHGPEMRKLHEWELRGY